MPTVSNGIATTPDAANLQGWSSRADEANDLITAVKDLVVQFIRAADTNVTSKQDGHDDHGLNAPNGTPGPASTLLEVHSPPQLSQLMAATSDFPIDEGRGRDGALALVRDVLRHSANTWDQGFLDKLYASTTPIGLAAELLLSALNTNVHVYAVSPALTLVEKRTGVALAHLFGLKGPRAGAISQPGGSAANQSSIVIARNSLYPETKTQGNGSHRFVLFTSVQGHYSVEKAAQMFGFGSDAVRAVPVDSHGRMRADELEAAILQARSLGETPFYVNATAGTTVLGSVDPLDAIAEICTRHRLWMHADASWGGSMVFSEKHRWRLQGTGKADSIAVCPHKMLGVPLTCSFLVAKDLREFQKGMTLPAGYLFHSDENDDETFTNGDNHINGSKQEEEEEEFWDLADLTPQCGRRGDSLKLALTWTYYGTQGLGASIDHAFEMSAYLASLVAAHPRFTLVSENPPPCLQVSFYFDKTAADSRGNSRKTEMIARTLVSKGFMVDFAPGEEGKFLRVVVNRQTRKETLNALVAAIDEVGSSLKK